MANNNNISEFAGKFLKGGIRPHMFEVDGMIGPSSNDSGETKIPFLVKAAQLPASTLGLIELPWRGRKIKVPGDRTFAEWTITILADGHFDLRDKFEAWSSKINSHEGNMIENEGVPLGSDSPAAALYPDWQVYQLDRKGNRIKGYNFVGCWPSEISAIDVNQETTDSVSEFTVTLQYSYWNSGTSEGNHKGPDPAPLADINRVVS